MDQLFDEIIKITKKYRKNMPNQIVLWSKSGWWPITTQECEPPEGIFRAKLKTANVKYAAHTMSVYTLRSRPSIEVFFGFEAADPPNEMVVAVTWDPKIAGEKMRFGHACSLSPSQMINLLVEEDTP